MYDLRPKSLSSWILIAYVAAGLPLLIATALAQLSLQELSHHSQLLIHEGTSVARLGSQLGTDVRNLERNARQYVAVGNEQLLALFYQRVAQVDATLNTMKERGLDKNFEFDLTRMREQLSDLVVSWNQALRDGNSLSASIDGVLDLGSQAQAMVQAGNASIDRETAALQAAAQRSQRRVLFCVVALLPATLLALWMLFRTTRASWQSLARAIAMLGASDHKQLIAVEGPEEFRQLGQRLDWLRRRLHELESEKERFLRHVSHELKTPLATMREAADLMGDESVGALNVQQRELRQLLLEASDDLRDQVGKLLAYAAWRMEQKQLQVAEFSAKELVENLQSTFKLQMDKKTLSWNISQRVMNLRGQQNRLMEACENLLSNAIKFAPENSAIELTIEECSGNFMVCVRDQGIGVPDNEKQMIFEPFARGRGALEAGLPGTGVGLSIVSECALAHGGEVFVKDAEPGSCFVLRWPVDSV